MILGFKKSMLFLVVAVMAVAMADARAEDNPFYAPYGTPFEVPAFDRIKNEHYLPAFEKGIAEQKKEIEAIRDNADAPTFENTVVAMEESGKLLNRVGDVFFNLNSAETSDEMQAIAREIAPRLSALNDDIYLDPKLFARVKSVYDKRDKLKLSTEQRRLLEESYKAFVRGGANLADAEKEEFRGINERLSVLSLKFGENILAEENRFELVIDNPADLSGLPAKDVEAAAEEAKTRGHEGKWVFTLHKPSLIPFLTYADNRALREKIYAGYCERGNHGDEYDNKAILEEESTLRFRRAQLLGYQNYAAYVLDDNMAKTPGRVYDLLNKLWNPALARAVSEREAMQAMVDAEGGNFKIASWDWWYYAERVKKQRYDFDDSVLRPYFVLDDVRAGAFEVATRLFGITFEERFDLPRYNEEVRTFEVTDADGSLLAIYYVDYHPRPGKRNGAWMNEYRRQSRKDGKRVVPIIVNVSNVSRATSDEPALLSLDEVSTLFHEFGHALHGMLSNVTYGSLSGTNVARDFVEMPSQVIENWATEPEVLKLYARHYQTGEQIPDELITKMNNAKLFNQGFATVEYLAASFLDMDWHTLEKPAPKDAMAFESQRMNQIGLIPEIVPRYRSPYFRHIFSGGYSAGYYSYIWAEVVDADAFQAFKENGLFDKKTADKFRKYVLSAGGTEEPMVLYKKFRGREPEIGPLLDRRGLNTDS
ncbi:MAG: M3 family metallopeptidase [Candidatus Krumholzibacteria bacterium]|nr:M3 family metallopeptidase [Candidatus Krumholzibacteria bacterium]MDH4336097.1 M3 family metallopeptidase [Candidatus Krumholzibacteria bacterium]MDH5268738.1 M3 family metallopeptidase [Candidatus Krumholzibacteria bacterium]MDH5627193.1 M3 family metallopeptidase [Candidatus Krumholzibacteria bacterium]